jgi:hypothetical protein
VIKRYRLLDYAAAKQAEERGQRELSRSGVRTSCQRNGFPIHGEITVRTELLRARQTMAGRFIQ